MTKIEADYIGIGGGDSGEISSEIAAIERAAAQGDIEVSLVHNYENVATESTPKIEQDIGAMAASAALRAREKVWKTKDIPEQRQEPLTDSQKRAMEFEQMRTQRIKEDVKYRFETKIEIFLRRLKEKGTLKTAASRNIYMKNDATNQELLKLLQH
jgi:hypothetical protein